MTTQNKYLKELGYLVVVRPDSHNCDFKIYSVTGVACDASETPLFGPNFEVFHEGLCPEITGDVKWDGCSNWTNPDTMLHGCTRHHLINIGKVLAACWDWSADLIPAWNKEVAG